MLPDLLLNNPHNIVRDKVLLTVTIIVTLSGN